jgi:hypothetical protein
MDLNFQIEFTQELRKPLHKFNFRVIIDDSEAEPHKVT